LVLEDMILMIFQFWLNFEFWFWLRFENIRQSLTVPENILLIPGKILIITCKILLLSCRILIIPRKVLMLQQMILIMSDKISDNVVRDVWSNMTRFDKMIQDSGNTW